MEHQNKHLFLILYPEKFVDIGTKAFLKRETPTDYTDLSSVIVPESPVQTYIVCGNDRCGARIAQWKENNIDPEKVFAAFDTVDHVAKDDGLTHFRRIKENGSLHSFYGFYGDK